MNLSLGALFFGHISFGMEKAVDKFHCFSQLEQELQLQVLAHADNQTSFQGVNKEWSAKGSITNPNVFSKDCCDIMYAKEKGLQKMSGVLLCAAYKMNNPGVENILKYSGIAGRFPSDIPFHSIDGNRACVLHLWGIVKHNNDNGLAGLLKKYKIHTFNDVICEPTDLKMACIAGESDTMLNLLSMNSNVDDKDLDQAVKLLIDFDHSKCLTALLSSSVGDKVKELFTPNPLYPPQYPERACMKKSLKTLDLLLKTIPFDINEKTTRLTEDYKVLEYTFLRHVLAFVTRDEDVIRVLRQNGAKTPKELQADQSSRWALNKMCTLQ